jgi:two-component system OmpR family sensor kinase
LNKIKNSLIVQTSFLFLLSIAFIIGLWTFFYLEQKHQNEEHNIARYFSVVSFLQPLLIQSQTITNDMVLSFNMSVFNKNVKEYKTILTRGDEKKGFKVLDVSGKRIIYAYNPVSSVYLYDNQPQSNLYFIHSIFFIFLVIQILLYIRIKKTLNPLSKIQDKLQNLEQGDLSHIEVDSPYEEINQIVSSYNSSISKIDYILEMREMFNKIFMHEMKMPIAKGMFYLKQEPSAKTHKQIHKLLTRLTNELDEFAILESLIVYKNEIQPSPHKLEELLDIAIEKVIINDKDTISIDLCEDTTIYGDKELWILCFKNLIDNALKYSTDGNINIRCKQDTIIFENKGDDLPLDISTENKKWKLEKDKRHKSSTGYGFGLFIIKNTILLNGYNLEYQYNNDLLQFRIKQCTIS